MTVSGPLGRSGVAGGAGPLVRTLLAPNLRRSEIDKGSSGF